MLWLLAAVVAASLLLRVPGWLHGGLLVLSLLLTTALAALGGLERALTPLLLQALALGLLIPSAHAKRAPRVAPPKGNTWRREGARDTSSPLDLWDIPGYKVLEKVGSGGMASVFRARRKRDGRIVALKIPAEGFLNDAKFIRRFHREAELAQRLEHPNIVRTYEHGSKGSKHYMAMEFVDGRSLESCVDERAFDLPVLLELMRQTVSALKHIHEAGVVHRDLKPANIMVRRGGVRPGPPAKVAADAVKLMDFGIAGGEVLSKLTVTGARVGTPTYMSPEQARGLRTDERSDIYSLGLVFYELLTGQAAFKGGYEVIVHQQIFQLPPPPRQLAPTVPGLLDRLVMRMIAKEPEARPSLREVEAVLREGDFREEVPDLRNRLLVVVDARQGAVRVLDASGTLQGALGEVGKGEGALPAAPQACVGDGEGNLYLALSEVGPAGADHPLIHKLSPAGVPLSAFGAYGVRPGELLQPVALGVAPGGTVFVLDAETHRVERFSGAGDHLSSFGGRGPDVGRFNDPRDLLVAPEGVYVLDYGNRRVQRFSLEGWYETRWAFRARSDPAGLRRLCGMARDRSGNLYLADGSSGEVHKVAPGGGVSTVLAVELAGENLVDLGLDGAGCLYLAPRGGHVIFKYDPGGRLAEVLETYAPILQMRLDVRG